MSEFTKKTLRIMLVENDEDDVFFVQRALTHAGFTYPLFRLRNGREAVDYFKAADASSPTFPHIVLMDMKMPGMDGLEVLRWLREESQFKDLSVVILTSSDIPADMSKSCRLGIYKFLTKRTHYDNVISTLESFLTAANALPSNAKMGMSSD